VETFWYWLTQVVLETECRVTRVSVHFRWPDDVQTGPGTPVDWQQLSWLHSSARWRLDAGSRVWTSVQVRIWLGKSGDGCW